MAPSCWEWALTVKDGAVWWCGTRLPLSPVGRYRWQRRLTLMCPSGKCSSPLTAPGATPLHSVTLFSPLFPCIKCSIGPRACLHVHTLCTVHYAALPSRMVSCGQSNIRLWRLKGKSLKSCPVDLGCHHQLLFTDVAFPEEVGSTGGARV